MIEEWEYLGFTKTFFYGTVVVAERKDQLLFTAYRNCTKQRLELQTVKCPTMLLKVQRQPSTDIASNSDSGKRRKRKEKRCR